MKTNLAKNFLTVEELKNICEKMNLPTDGLKSELIERILNFEPLTSSSSTKPNYTTHGTQTSNEILVSKFNGHRTTGTNVWNPSFIWKVLIFIGFFGSCLALAQFFFTGYENIEIPVKKSFFW